MQRYMKDQPHLNSMMRAILIDWLVEVHAKFRLVPETLYLGVNIIDRYLSEEKVDKKELQLVGITSLLLACKYEEIYPPEVKDCVYITDKAYTREQVLEMEAKIVKTLKFHLTVPTAYNFLIRFLHVTEASETVKNLARYYSERMLQEYDSLRFRPSVLAAAAVTLAVYNPTAMELENRQGNHEGLGMVSGK
jgi:G2/mitotic-specific cyclin-B, other